MPGVSISSRQPGCGPKASTAKWLFQRNVSPKELEELDPKNQEYWGLQHKQNTWHHSQMSKHKKV
jgi:hypothetical protein